MKVREFRCKHCGNQTQVSLWFRINHMHLFGKYLFFKCPECGKRSWQKRVKIEEK